MKLLLIGIIGGADGPTSIFTANKLAKHLIGPIAVAAYTYMALVPLIQPPIMRAMTNDAERKIRMKALRQVSKAERIVFAVMVMIVCVLVVPDASALIIMLMMGNIFKEAGVVERLVKTSHDVCRHLPQAADSHDYRYGCGCLWLLHFRRFAPCKDHEQVLSEEPGEPAYRFRRRFCRADGCPCFPG